MDLGTLFEGVELSDDVKAVLAEKFKGAVGAEVEGLKTKNTELLGKLSETKNSITEAGRRKSLG